MTLEVYQRQKYRCDRHVESEAAKCEAQESDLAVSKLTFFVSSAFPAVLMGRFAFGLLASRDV